MTKKNTKNEPYSKKLLKRSTRKKIRDMKRTGAYHREIVKKLGVKYYEVQQVLAGKYIENNKDYFDVRSLKRKLRIVKKENDKKINEAAKKAWNQAYTDCLLDIRTLVENTRKKIQKRNKGFFRKLLGIKTSEEVLLEGVRSLRKIIKLKKNNIK